MSFNIITLVPEWWIILWCKNYFDHKNNELYSIHFCHYLTTSTVTWVASKQEMISLSGHLISLFLECSRLFCTVVKFAFNNMIYLFPSFNALCFMIEYRLMEISVHFSWNQTNWTTCMIRIKKKKIRLLEQKATSIIIEY